MSGFYQTILTSFICYQQIILICINKCSRLQCCCEVLYKDYIKCCPLTYIHAKSSVMCVALVLLCCKRHLATVSLNTAEYCTPTTRSIKILFNHKPFLGSGAMSPSRIALAACHRICVNSVKVIQNTEI